MAIPRWRRRKMAKKIGVVAANTSTGVAHCLNAESFSTSRSQTSTLSLSASTWACKARTVAASGTGGGPAGRESEAMGWLGGQLAACRDCMLSVDCERVTGRLASASQNTSSEHRPASAPCTANSSSVCAVTAASASEVARSGFRAVSGSGCRRGSGVGCGGAGHMGMAEATGEPEMVALRGAPLRRSEGPAVASLLGAAACASAWLALALEDGVGWTETLVKEQSGEADPAFWDGDRML
mmetsp:Transcript_40118/g.76687  ORF Transcript_40118/g.76687 Transcript_40118/m.76687 type:complete len:240 (-) Transcript_40118:444-1163(-)